MITGSYLATYRESMSGQIISLDYIDLAAYKHHISGQILSVQKEVVVEKLIGRQKELSILDKIYKSPEAEFLALYGRRRVGKTFLIRNFFENKGLFFEVTGLKDGSLKEQLKIFTESFQKTFYRGLPLQQFQSWNQAFALLTSELEKIPKNKKIIISLDELPWLATPKSGLLQNLDHFWNTRWSRMTNLKIILCGSAASWMLEKLIFAKGGLHNRITQTIRLQQFNLREVKEYLHSRGIRLNNHQILEIYMAMGGIPYYLRQIEKGRSAAQIVDAVCFQRNGVLYDEFKKLFASLFKHSEANLKIFKEIAKHRYGITRNRLLQLTGTSTGGRFNDRIYEMEEAGFIASFVPYGKVRKEHSYRVIDEYSYFYLKWIQNAPRGILLDSSSGYWKQQRQTQSWKAWSGYSFEGVCLKHSDKIRASLGIDNIACEIGTWHCLPRKGSKDAGAQIDLLFDRSDGAITICELKYSGSKFTLNKSYVEKLKNKINVFKTRLNIKKQFFLVLVTNFGVAKNRYYDEMVSGEVKLDDLFR